jgi:hypothetical protein
MGALRLAFPKNPAEPGDPVLVRKAAKKFYFRDGQIVYGDEGNHGRLMALRDTGNVGDADAVRNFLAGSTLGPWTDAIVDALSMAAQRAKPVNRPSGWEANAALEAASAPARQPHTPPAPPARPRASVQPALAAPSPVPRQARRCARVAPRR